MEYVGQLIRQRRGELGITQLQLANRTGLEQTYISKVETGKVRRPEQEMLDLFALGLDLDPDVLYLAVFGHRRQEVTPGDEIPLRTLARVPADASRWGVMLEEYEGRDVQIPTSWMHRAAHPLFAIDVSGNCLEALQIRDGDTVICEEYHGQTIPDGKAVLVRVENECTLKAWYRVGPSHVELRNGAGVVVCQLTDTDCFEVLGVVYRIIGDR